MNDPKADIRFLLEQLSTIEHAQDRPAIAAVAKRYGFVLPLFPVTRKLK